MLFLTQTLFGNFLLVMMLGLVPAYVLGRFLPADAAMSGPFQGMTVSFGGSFALYLAILLMGGGVIVTSHNQPTTYERVTISGTLRFEGGEGIERDESLVRVQFKPELHILNPSKSDVFEVEMTLPATRTVGRGLVSDFSRGSFSYPGYFAEPFDLKLAEFDANREARFGDVTLRARPEPIESVAAD